MSKAVRSVGRAVKKVVSGIGRVIKKVASSKIGKIILAASTVYFGGAALMGAMGGASGGVMGAISGAGSGLSSAASGISSAWTALMDGSITGAGSALADGFMGTGGASSTVAGGGLISPATSMSETMLGATKSAATASADVFGGVEGVGTSVYGQVGPAAGNSLTGGSSLLTNPGTLAKPTSSGLLSQILDSRYVAPALITAGSQMAGGLINAYGTQKAADDQIKRYNTNVGYDAGWKKYG